MSKPRKHKSEIRRRLESSGDKVRRAKLPNEMKENKAVFDRFQQVIDVMKKSQNRSDELIERLEQEQMKYKKRPELN